MPIKTAQPYDKGGSLMTLLCSPKSRNGGMVEWWSGGVVEWWSGGIGEWQNGGMLEKPSKS